MPRKVYAYTDNTGFCISDDESRDKYKGQLPGGCRTYKDIMVKVIIAPDTGALLTVWFDGLSPEEFQRYGRPAMFQAIWAHCEKNVAPHLWEKYTSGEWEIPEE